LGARISFLDDERPEGAVSDLLAFIGVALVVIVTPGPDTAVTVRSTLLGGRRAGVFTALGVVSGQACWTLAASAGLTALLVASEPAFVAVKALGAAYLVYLGVQALRIAAGRRTLDDAGASRQNRRVVSATTAYRHGLLSDLGNPKMAAFFTSLLPQFVPAHHPTFSTMLVLGLVFGALTLAWLVAYTAVVGKAREVLTRSRVRRVIEGVTGCVLIALGLRVVTEHR
jgi:threonine/homoserine/homoserine lactone efflux protein